MQVVGVPRSASFAERSLRCNDSIPTVQFIVLSTVDEFADLIGLLGSRNRLAVCSSVVHYKLLTQEALMIHSQRIATVILFCLLPALAYAQQAVELKGTWELVSQKEDGKDHPVSGRQIKLLTGTHYAWVRQDKKMLAELLAKKTQRDSISAYQDAFGAGTYKVVGNTYTETTEFFYAPQYIGTSLAFKFKFDGGLWYTSGHYSHFEGGKRINEVLLEQVFKRID